jgi:uncharacterized protein (TIGR02118 family)
MAHVIAIYKQPADTAAFDTYYHTKHVPLAKTLPGLRSYLINSTPVAPVPGGNPPYLVALLEFDSMAAIEAALNSPEGRATAGDLGNFAQAGVDLLMFDTKAV